MKKKLNDTFVLEEDILFTNEPVFGNQEDHSYNVKCYDGYAVATKNNKDDNCPERLNITYKTLKEVLENEELAYSILEYRGLTDLKPTEITYGDIMLYCGEISVA